MFAYVTGTVSESSAVYMCLPKVFLQTLLCCKYFALLALLWYQTNDFDVIPAQNVSIPILKYHNKSLKSPVRTEVKDYEMGHQRIGISNIFEQYNYHVITY